MVRRDFIDHGAPEFYVTEIELEVLHDSDLVRVYAIHIRNGERVLQYTALIPRHCLLANARQSEAIARSRHISGDGDQDRRRKTN
jgi:hypothetical protein